MALNDSLRNGLERVKTRIIDQQSGLGIRLSGASASSLVVTRSRSVKTGRFTAGASLVSIAYLVTNFAGIGVSPGTFPPFGPGSKLFRWVRARGITTRDDRGRIQTAAQTTFLIARKINAEGTRINRGTSPGIDYNQIVNDELPELLDDVTGDITAGILEDFNKAILL